MTAHPNPNTFAEKVPLMGYRPLYHGAETYCPVCAGTNWIVGRISAECGRCSTALPLAGGEVGR